jgi:hypothetical protein
MDLMGDGPGELIIKNFKNNQNNIILHYKGNF